MNRLEESRSNFINSIETDYPAFDREGAFQDSVRMESAAKAFRMAAEAFVAEVDKCVYATMDAHVINAGFPGKPLACIEDAVQAFIDAFTWDIRGEALSFLHEASKGEKSND